MCGIFGLFHIEKTSRPNETDWESLLQNVNKIQKHRGPDEQRFTYNVLQGWGLAHQRLALLDLSAAGRQPMLSHSNLSTLVYNGEVYNHKELAKQLELNNLKGHSDTEVVLEGLEKLNEDLISQLDGMFAFGYFNHRTQKLLLAVDPAGEKPLYTYWDGKVFAFASEIRTLLSLPGINKTTNNDAIKKYLVYGYVPNPATIYRYIRKLPAGCYQKFDCRLGPSKAIPYWQLLDHCKTKKVTYPDAKSELNRLLTSAVSKRLIADVPVGSFLSGGLDSSIISYLAAQANSTKQIETYSVSFNSNDIPSHYDESKYAKFVANLIKSNHHEIHLDFVKLDSSNIISQFGEPFADSSSIPTYFLCKETSKYLKAVLSGDGGDELFGGYLRFRAGLISQQFGPYLKSALALFNFKNVNHRSKLGFLMRFKNRLNNSILSQQAAWNSYFDQHDFKMFLNESIDDIYEDAVKFEKETGHLESGQKILYYNFKTYLFDDLLPKVDRMSMANGLEVRAPFLDKALIEFAFSLPTNFKFTYFTTKRILKDIYAPIFGNEFVHRKKMGFALPIEKYIKNQDMNNCLTSLKNANTPGKWQHTEMFTSQIPNYYQKSYLLLSLQNHLLYKS